MGMKNTPRRARAAAVPFSKLPGSLPEADIPDDVDHAGVASSFIQNLSTLRSEDIKEDGFWRDLLALTGTLRTFYGAESIAQAWDELSSLRKPADFSLIPGSSCVTKFGPTTCWVQARFSFVITGRRRAKCSGLIRLVLGLDGRWKIWILSTILEEVEGFGNPDVFDLNASMGSGQTQPRLTNGAQNGIDGGTEINGNVPNGTNYRATDFGCAIVGAGMAGLCVAGRLKAMGVSTVNLDRNAQIGGNWTSRYASVKIHTAKEYGQLPFGRVFGPEEPYFLTAKDLARGYQKFVDQYGINIWLSTVVESAAWNDEARTWTVTIDRDGKPMQITARHVVFATGAGGQIPTMPEYSSREIFKGIILHSAAYNSANEWKGKKGVVIGAANTAHDVADDMLKAGLASVTMVQRNATPILPVQYYRHIFDGVYNEKCVMETTDREMFGVPNAILRHQANTGMWAVAAKDPERFDALERVGFKTERYIDVYHVTLERQGGHYLDVGVSQEIVDGLIKIKSDAALIGYTRDGLEFSDGSELKADVVVFCTGFQGNMRLEVAKIVGEEIGDVLEDYLCLDKEGEVRGAWRPPGHRGIWYAGGAMGFARFYSRFLAMQIKADVEGVPFEPYTKTPCLSP